MKKVMQNQKEKVSFAGIHFQTTHYLQENHGSFDWVIIVFSLLSKLNQM